MLPPVERLLAIEDIKILKARYFRFVDSHDWAGLREVFAEDATFCMPQMPGPDLAKALGASGPDLQGVEAIVERISTVVEHARSVHMGYLPEIEIISADEARGIWGMRDVVRWDGGRKFQGYGYYQEHYVRRDGKWLIKKCELSYKAAEFSHLGTTADQLVG